MEKSPMIKLEIQSHLDIPDPLLTEFRLQRVFVCFYILKVDSIFRRAGHPLPTFHH